MYTPRANSHLNPNRSHEPPAWKTPQKITCTIERRCWGVCARRRVNVNINTKPNGHKDCERCGEWVSECGAFCGSRLKFIIIINEWMRVCDGGVRCLSMVHRLNNEVTAIVADTAPKPVLLASEGGRRSSFLSCALQGNLGHACTEKAYNLHSRAVSVRTIERRCQPLNHLTQQYNHMMHRVYWATSI